MWASDGLTTLVQCIHLNKECLFAAFSVGRMLLKVFLTMSCISHQTLVL